MELAWKSYTELAWKSSAVFNKSYIGYFLITYMFTFDKK